MSNDIFQRFSTDLRQKYARFFRLDGTLIGSVGGGGSSGPLISITGTLFIGVHGQSNASGSGATVITTTNQYAQNFKVLGPSIFPISESTTEKPDSNIANYLSWIEPTRASIIINASVGGTSITGLNSGSQPYQVLIRGFQTGSNIYSTQQEVAVALYWDQGESDFTVMSSASYASKLVLLQQRLQSDLQAELHTTGAASSIPLFYAQKSNLGQWTTTQLVNELAYAQANAWRMSGSNGMKLVAPTYFLAYSGSGADIHYINTSVQHIAEYAAKAINKEILSGSTWAPLYIQSITGSGNGLTVQVGGGDGSSLSIDNSLMLQRHNAGFRYLDDTTSSAAITNVSVSGRTISISLNKDADLTGRLRYGLETGKAAIVGNIGNAEGGNIRDNDTTYAPRSGSNLYNWLIEDERSLNSYSGGGTPVGIWRATGSLTIPNGARYVGVNGMEDLDGTTRATWSYWFRKLNTAPTAEVSLWAKNITNQRCFDHRITSSRQLRTYISSGSLSNIINWLGPASMFTVGTWAHVVVVFDGNLGGGSVPFTDRLKVYFNGQPVHSSGTYSATPPSSLVSGSAVEMAIGGQSNNQGNQLREIDMKDFCLWNGTAMTYGQVGELYNSGTITNPALHSVGAPTHHWRLQEDFADYGTGSVRHGTGYAGLNVQTSFSSSGP